MKKKTYCSGGGELIKVGGGKEWVRHLVRFCF